MRVCRDDPNERDTRKVESFGNHLRTEQDVGVAVAESLQQAVVRPLANRCVEVHAQNLCFRKVTVEFLFHFLRPDPSKRQVGTSAGGALHVRRPDQTAIMTAQMLLCKVICHRHIAVLAHLHVAAIAAFHKGSKPSSVLEKNDPFAPRQPIGDLFPEERRKGRLHEVPEATPFFRRKRFLPRGIVPLSFRCHIHEHNRRQRDVINAGGHMQECVLPFGGVPQRFCRRRGGSENNDGMGLTSAHNGHIARVVTGG